MTWRASRDGERTIALFEAPSSAAATRHAALLQQGYAVRWCSVLDGPAPPALEACEIAIIQWSMPGQPGGPAIARQLRARNSGMAILMLEGSADPAERRRALGELVDDCVDASCEAAELLAHVKALSRRIDGWRRSLGTVGFGPVRIDFTGGVVEVDGEEVSLQPLQLKILGFLLKNAGRVVGHEELRRHVFRVAQAASSTSLPRQVSVLRKRLGPAGELIVTCRGGYGIGVHRCEPCDAAALREETEP